MDGNSSTYVDGRTHSRDEFDLGAWTTVAAVLQDGHQGRLTQLERPVVATQPVDGHAAPTAASGAGRQSSARIPMGGAHCGGALRARIVVVSMTSPEASSSACTSSGLSVLTGSNVGVLSAYRTNS